MPERPTVFTGTTVANGELLRWGTRTYVVGVINVTPDSFSGDGLGSNVRAAVEQALRFEGEGADILDVGAESTRPSHQPVSEAEEVARLLPPLEAIAARVSIPISVDTWKARVAVVALDAGAHIIMLDNMPAAMMREAMEFIGDQAVVEASGGINFDTVRAVAETGVHLISIGELTHSPAALDISLDLEFE